MIISYAADILQRLSPYLQRNTPVDILDLWPSTGIFSSQVNKYLKPRRHLLVEPNAKTYEKSLKKLVKAGGGYEMVSLDPYSLYDWNEVFAKHLPEQGPSNTQEGQVLPRNDTLLVLANIPEQRSIRDHFTPARWWSVMMESCLNRRGVHMYGSVRILASLPGNTKCSVLPRTVIDRRRTSMLTETVALHAFEVASTYENETWQSLKPWDNLRLNRERVAERAAANNVITPAGREIPPLELAPESPRPGRLSQVYMPRPRVEWHDTVMVRIAKESSKNKVVKRDAQTALYSLNLDNKQAWWCHHVAKAELEEDEASRSLARIAATSPYPEELDRADKRSAGLKDTVEKLLQGTHHRVMRGHDRVTDDARLLHDAGSFDNSILMHDRRPFEALRINTEDQYPRLPRTLVYFEADPNPPVVQKLSQLSDEKRVELIELFDTLSSIFSTRDQLNLAELYGVIFPLRTANEIVKEFPVLAKYAMKRLKPGCGPVSLPDPTLDPNECFQENIDYDLSYTRVRRLPVSLIWDILLQYQNSGPDVSPMQFNRLLGGTLTGAATGGASGNALKLR